MWRQAVSEVVPLDNCLGSVGVLFSAAAGCCANLWALRTKFLVGSGYAGLVTSGEVRNGDLRCVIDAGGEVRICGTLVWGYERGGSYVPCSHLRLL